MKGNRSMQDMTEGRPISLILKFFFPLLFGMLFQQFYNLVDTAIVGKFLGPDDLAAVGATGSVNFSDSVWVSAMAFPFLLPRNLVQKMRAVFAALWQTAFGFLSFLQLS